MGGYGFTRHGVFRMGPCERYPFCSAFPGRDSIKSYARAIQRSTLCCFEVGCTKFQSSCTFFKSIVNYVSLKSLVIMLYASNHNRF